MMIAFNDTTNPAINQPLASRGDGNAQTKQSDNPLPQPAAPLKDPGTNKKEQPASPHSKGQATYRSQADGLYRVTYEKKEELLQRLTNFPAKIIAELVVTEGVEETREFEIEATLDGETKQIIVTPMELESTNWILKKLGARAIVSAGYGIGDHVRAAIQQLSPQIPIVKVYTQTGWVHHDGRAVFLHAGGAIGADGEICLDAGAPTCDAATSAHQAAGSVDKQGAAGCDVQPPENATATHDIDDEEEPARGVEASRGDDLHDARAEKTKDRPRSNPRADNELQTHGTIGTIGNRYTHSVGLRVRFPSALQGYRLPTPPTGDALVKAVRASLEFLNTACDRVSIPLAAAIWRAPLGEVNFALQAVGRTQVGKTVLAALAQQHFGAGMDAEHLPAAWCTTGNAIVAMTFLAKDVLLTLDDFVPTGSRGDTDQAHRKAEMVLRAQGNHAGRMRCRGDGSLIEGKAPRCLLLSTGEDTPDGQSLNSRGLILPVGSGDVNWDWVSTCQGHAASGLFSQAMAGFLQWMARDYERICFRTRSQIKELHGVFRDDSTPSRTAAIAANLLAGLENFMEFALDCGAITEDQFDALWERAHEALWAAIGSHKNDQDGSDPTQRFCDLLAEAFHSGRAYVATRLGEPPNILPEAWGWEKQVVVVPVDKDKYRSFDSIAEEQEAKMRGAVEDAQEGIETEELFKHHHRGEQIGWWDFNDNLYLLPDVTLAVVQRLAQANGRPLPITSRTLGKLLQASGMLKSHRAGRHTKQIMANNVQASVLHIAASSINPWDPDPLSKEEQEEWDKLYDGLTA